MYLGRKIHHFNVDPNNYKIFNKKDTDPKSVLGFLYIGTQKNINLNHLN